MNEKNRQRMQEWRERLVSASATSQLGMLEAGHKRAGLTDRFGFDIQREIEEDTGFELFECMQTFMKQGVMPPPEVLLTLLENWQDYLTEDYQDKKGQQRATALERHMIGDFKKGVGNYASRRRAEAVQLSQDMEPHAILMGTKKVDRVNVTPLTRQDWKDHGLVRRSYDEVVRLLNQMGGRPSHEDRLRSAKRRAAKQKSDK